MLIPKLKIKARLLRISNQSQLRSMCLSCELHLFFTLTGWAVFSCSDSTKLWLEHFFRCESMLAFTQVKVNVVRMDPTVARITSLVVACMNEHGRKINSLSLYGWADGLVARPGGVEAILPGFPYLTHKQFKHAVTVV